MPTVTFTLPFISFWNSSATASVTGKTVLDPSILITVPCARTVGTSAVNNDPKAASGRSRFVSDCVFITESMGLACGDQVIAM
jgi:hypothetical protein